MTRSKGLLCAALFFIVALQGYCQYPYPRVELAELALNRTLAVQLLYEDSEVEEALNQVLKETVMTYYEGEAEFFFPPELEKAMRKNGEDYAFLTQPEFLEEDVRMDISYVDGSFHSWILGGSNEPSDLARHEVEDFRYESVRLGQYQFILSLIDGRREKQISTVILPNGNVGKHDHLFIIQQFDLLLGSAVEGVMRSDFVDVEENIDRIKSTTCYFLKDYFSEETQAEFTDFYEYPYELVSFQEYQQVILNRQEESTYIRIIFSFQHNKYMWVIVDASDGRVLALNDIGDYKFTGTFDATNLIKPRHLKLSLSEDTQLLNNYYNK